MNRPPSQVISAWIALLPALLRLGVRRARRAAHRRPHTSAVIAGASTAGSFSCQIGPSCPVVVDHHAVGTLSTHDDDGTSTAEHVLVLRDGAAPDVVRLVVDTATSAAFDRGNHRACWRVSDDDHTTLAALRDAGFTHEGRAAPLVRDPHTWQAWSRLSTEQPVPA